MIFQGEIIKDSVVSALLPLRSLALEKASSHAVRTLKQHYGEIPMARN